MWSTKPRPYLLDRKTFFTFLDRKTSATAINALEMQLQHIEYERQRTMETASDTK